jgi:hypothetical protein
MSIKAAIAYKAVALQLVSGWYNIFCTKNWTYIKQFLLLFIFIICILFFYNEILELSTQQRSKLILIQAIEIDKNTVNPL